MALLPEHHLVLERFLHDADFEVGSVHLDLDGTSIQELDGKPSIDSTIAEGVGKIVAQRQPVILNTLRFARRVTEKFAEKWLKFYNQRIPVVLLNGALIGFVDRNESNEIVFEEVSAHTLLHEQIDTMIRGLKELLEEHGIRRMNMFFYPRDWRKGEILWVPSQRAVEEMREVYFTASEVMTCSLDELSDRIKREETCLCHVMVHEPKENLMSYQHTEPNDYFSPPGIDKASGAKEMSKHLGVSMIDSLGAGDSEMDTFLGKVGLSVIVGKKQLPLSGLRESLRVDDIIDMGDLLISYADKIQRRRASMGAA